VSEATPVNSASTGVRTRFAPSPTGRLHLGNLRIAVFNWLFARRHGGAFILRIEDTDAERNVAGSEATVCDDLRWLGLDWDEGPDVGGPHAPYRQCERGPVYRKTAEQLLRDGNAYRCWCTDAELEESREQVGGGEVLRYSGRCRRLTAEERARNERDGRPSVVRFAVPEGQDAIHIEDAVRGEVLFPRADVTDFVILRTEGTPTYNFAVVADDVDMEITHVIRHVGHLSNTPRQALLFDALGRPRPVFAHLPTVLAPGGGKLSKRSGDAGADELRAQGLEPDGVLNYLSLLGWSAEDEREVLTREELTQRISLERVGRSDTTFDAEKLRWLSGQHIAKRPSTAVVEAVGPFLDRERYPLEGDALKVAVETIRTRLTAYGEVNEHLRWFFPPAPALAEAQAAVRGDPAARGVVDAVAKRLAATEPWTPAVLSAAVRDIGREIGVRGSGLFHPVRKAVTGDESGPDLGGILGALGREEVLARLSGALEPPAGGGLSIRKR
jgi:nondiscriminating glutamyl-tRNA synthetase